MSIESRIRKPRAEKLNSHRETVEWKQKPIVRLHKKKQKRAVKATKNKV